MDRTGCFKLNGKLYDAGPEWAGKTVEIRYDPFALEEAEVWLNGKQKRIARELVMDQPRRGPGTKAVESPGRSRYLDVLAQKEKERRKRRLGAISFRELGGGGDV